MIVSETCISEESCGASLSYFQELDKKIIHDLTDLVLLLADICKAPFAAINFLKPERICLIAQKGFSVSEIPLKESFCQHILHLRGVQEFNALSEDERFCNLPLVMQAPQIRFYAALPLRRPDGELFGTLCIWDVKERVLLPNQKFTLETLGRQVVNLFELLIANRRLKLSGAKNRKGLEAKAEFLSIISHELRTPLDGIISMANWLEQDNPRKEQLELIHTLKFSADNLMHLVNDILDFKKLQAGKLCLERLDFDLGHTLQQLSRAFLYMAQQKGLQWKTDWPASLPAVVGDPLRLNQVLNNLIANAMKFTPSGEVSLTVSEIMETDRHITLRFSVKDTGIGIPEDKFDLIFTEFVQASPDISRKFGGTGLGLTITRNLLTLMGSEVQVKSHVGRGSEFTFNISFQKAQTQQGDLIDAEKPTAFLPTKELQGKRILIVEDNQVNQLITLRHAETLGLEVALANDGQEAVHMASVAIYDLILMDLQMPVMDGFEASKLIRNLNDHYRKVPIIALTASLVKAQGQEVLESGITDFLMKPFQVDDFYKLLQHYLLTDFCQKGIKVHLSLKLKDLSAGDEPFRIELITLLIRSFQEISSELKNLSSVHEDALQRLRHKHKTTLQVLELKEFSAALDGLQQELSNTEKNDAKIQESGRTIKQMCEVIISQLKDIQAESDPIKE